MIKTLTLKDFRNYKNRTFECAKKNIVLFGKNGQGKTNVLEAISILSVGKSWRETKNQDLIRDGEESALIEARMENLNQYNIFIQKRGKSFEKNEKKIPLTRHFGSISTLLFVPEYLTLFSGARSNRVRFFDRFLFQISPELRGLLGTFNKALKNKNALLKNYDGPLFSAHSLTAQLQPWNEILAETIPQIIAIRTKLLSDTNPLLQSELDKISGITDPIEISLSIKEDYDLSKNGVLEYFQKHQNREIVAGKCLIGAHLDDFTFTYRDKPILATASRGEERSVLLSLLSAQKQIIQSTLGKTPILLLDDVFSELDQSRQDALENLCSDSQIFFTTTHDSHFKNFSQPCQKIEIHSF